MRQRRGHGGQTTSGYKVVVVVGDDATNNEVDSVEVVIGDPTNPDSQVVDLPLRVVKPNGNKRFVFNQLDFYEGYGVGDSVDLTSTMLNELSEQVGDSDSRTVTVLDQPPPRLRRASITQLDDVNFELSVTLVSDDDMDVVSVDVFFADYTGPTPIPEELALWESVTNDNGRRVFSSSTVTFEDPSLAADEVYNVVIDFKAEDGSSLGASEYEIIVEGLEAI